MHRSRGFSIFQLFTSELPNLFRDHEHPCFGRHKETGNFLPVVTTAIRLKSLISVVGGVLISNLVVWASQAPFFGGRQVDLGLFWAASF